jgi:sarcosine oxidase delta subunit
MIPKSLDVKDQVLAGLNKISFDLGNLTKACPSLSEGFCRVVAEACAVCLEEQGHLPGSPIEVRGIANTKVPMRWDSVSDQVRDTHADPEVATEHGAIAIAMLTVNSFTDYTIIRRSMKGTGFDYWLSSRGSRPYRNDARLEISGIRTGTERQLKARIRQKARQTNRSDGTLPAWIAVVEFSHPISYLQRKEDL